MAQFNQYIRQTIAAEINRFGTYYDEVIQLGETTNEGVFGFLRNNKKSQLIQASELAESDTFQRRLLLLDGQMHHQNNIQEGLSELHNTMSRGDRLVSILINPYFRWFYRLAGLLDAKRSQTNLTFITNTNLRNLAKLTGFEVVRLRNVGYSPFKLWGVGDWINKIMPTLPLLRWLAFSSVVVLRPVKSSQDKPSLSIVIPARNESGNIENALKRLPEMKGTKIEVIFVEGNSTDDTWEEIQRVVKLPAYKHLKLAALQQPGKGKKDAVMVGFEKAEYDLLTILDADLTMPPEALPQFYQAYCDGKADMVNGNRLMYPMEDEAMRFLNRLGNLFFAKTLSRVLDMPIGDSLCGTKLISQADHYRYLHWLEDFGDFDPFGDFQLLFPSAELCLGSVDIPIVYKARTYGSTNINRFRDGLILLKMTSVGWLKIKLGATPKND